MKPHLWDRSIQLWRHPKAKCVMFPNPSQWMRTHNSQMGWIFKIFIGPILDHLGRQSWMWIHSFRV